MLREVQPNECRQGKYRCESLKTFCICFIKLVILVYSILQRCSIDLPQATSRPGSTPPKLAITTRHPTFASCSKFSLAI